MKFFKYQACGNDFVVFESFEGTPKWVTTETVRLLCDRHFGIGADGLLLIERGREASFFMRVFNADGSQAEMCGNGIRCVAKHLREQLGVVGEVVNIETLAGVKPCKLKADDQGIVASVAVSLGRPVLARTAIPMAGQGDALFVRVSALGRDFVGHGIGMGNPHFVIFEGMGPREAERYGAVLSTSPLFPRHANIEFAQQTGPEVFDVLVFERGCGLTLACGTGAGAVAVAAVLTGRAKAGVPLTMHLPGGTLQITVEKDLSDVILEGPAVLVYVGQLAPGLL